MQALLLATLLTLAAVPPLTREQVNQLDTATDDDKLVDQAALYPLLQNAMEWTPGDEAGATVPDYAAILASPADARGDLFLIEGRFFRSLPLNGLARPGPWTGEAGQEWAIVYDDKTQQALVLYLVNGPVKDNMPKPRQMVRAPARFLKVWVTNDLKGNPTRYPVFVGNSARVVGTADGGGRMLSPTAIIVLVIALSLIFFGVRRFLRMREQGLRERSAERESRRDQPETPDETNEPPLPADPVQAMAELERRRKAETGEG